MAQIKLNKESNVKEVYRDLHSTMAQIKLGVPMAVRNALFTFHYGLD